VNEGVSAAVVRLNEAETLRRIEPFNCASGHDGPFHSNIELRQRERAADYAEDDVERKSVQGAVPSAR
jgi:hypothetical protein